MRRSSRLAGYTLALRYQHAGHADLGRQYLERALALDPKNARALSGLAGLRDRERSKQILTRLEASGARDAFGTYSDATYAAVSALPEEDRLFYLPAAAESAYMSAENVDYMAKSKPEAEQAEMRKRAAAGFARSRQYANDALALAERHPQSPEYGDIVYRANTTLGVLALKDGDREAAVKHMAAAAAAPIPGGGRVQAALRLAQPARRIPAARRRARVSGAVSREVGGAIHSRAGTPARRRATDPRRRDAAVLPVGRSQTLTEMEDGSFKW